MFVNYDGVQTSRDFVIEQDTEHLIVPDAVSSVWKGEWVNIAKHFNR